MSIDFQALRAANPIVEVVGRYLDVVRRGTEYKALCPFHADKNPSLCVVPSKGKAFCQPCDWHGDVLDFIADIENLRTPDGERDYVAAAKRLGHLPTERPAVRHVQAPPDESDHWRPIMPAPDDAPPYDPGRTWNPRAEDKRAGRLGKFVDWNRSRTHLDPYLDPAGRILGYVVRLEFDGQKMPMAVTYCRHDETGESRWCAVKFPDPRPLLGLDELASRPNDPVMVVSGEKCRDAARSVLPKFVAVTWSGGDQNWHKTDWAPLYGRRATFWPDLDQRRVSDDPGAALIEYESQSGYAAMTAAASLLVAHGSDCRMLDLRVEFASGELPGGWDVADAVESGWDSERVKEFCRTRVRDFTQTESKSAGAESQPGGGPESVIAHREERAAPATEDDTRRERREQMLQAMADPEFATANRPFFEDIEFGPRLNNPARVTLTGRINADLEQTVDSVNDDVPSKYSEDNVALAFAEQFQDHLRYVAAWGRWMDWDGQRWVHDESLKAYDYSRKICRFVASNVKHDRELTPKQVDSVAKTYGAASVVAAVERLAKSDRRLAATVDQWDADHWALNTPGGVVDLRTGLMRPARREDHMTKITLVAPGGDCPTWRKFLRRATDGDLDLVAFMQRVAGYCLTGSVRDHALFFVYGTGGNGKGTFLNTITSILNDYAAVAGIDTFTETKNDRHTTELARLRGARLVAAQEVEEGKRWAEAKIKALTGGDPITARFMRMDDFTFTPQFKLVIAGNHKPGLRNVDEAIKRRLHLIPFTVTIPAEERDPRLAEKLMAEASGILAWAIEGCVDWLNGGLRPPDSVRAATAEYMDQQDTLGAWIEDECESGANVSAKSSTLYDSFKRWAERSGEYVLPLKRWIAAMESRGLVAEKRKAGMFYQGIGVQDRGDYRQSRFED